MIDLNIELTAAHRMEIAEGYIKRGTSQDMMRAVVLLESVTDIEPNNIIALTNQAVIYMMQKQYALSRARAMDALKIDPDFSRAIETLARVAQDLDDFDEACRLYERATQLDPNNSVMLANHAYLRQLLGDYKGSLALYDQARIVNVGDFASRFQRSLCLLSVASALNEWEEALSEYDLRHMLFKLLTPGGPPRPRYTGAESLEGRHLMMVSEQGVGDSVMMGRYARYLKTIHGARAISVYTNNKVNRNLLAWIEGVDGAYAPEDTLPDYDFQIPVLSLLRAEHYPIVHASAQPYLRKPLIALNLPIDNRFRIGFCWQGNREHGNDHYRSIPVARMAQAFEGLSGHISAWSLQQPAETNEAPGWMQNADIASLDKLAAVIGSMDLVVTVDSAPAHIAGAMGIETIMLLPVNADWRWPRAGTTTDWYPTVTLARCGGPLAWDAPLSQAAHLAANAIARSKGVAA